VRELVDQLLGQLELGVLDRDRGVDLDVGEVATSSA
jgi:hypothetical protein